MVMTARRMQSERLRLLGLRRAVHLLRALHVGRRVPASELARYIAQSDGRP